VSQWSGSDPGTTLPCRSEHVVSRSLGAKVVLYNPEVREVSVLNATAAVVWEMCDGATPMADAVTRMKSRFRIAETRDVAADVTAVLQTLSGRGLLRASGLSPTEEVVG
jgi:Coenzyme PQQ synthesis protein D (PqqD)